MDTVLVILGREVSDFAKGNYNQGLFEATVDFLGDRHRMLTTDIAAGYDPAEELAKFEQAEAVIYQYPVYWFTMPPTLKKYIDEVYAYGAFFGHGDGPYGSGGLMKGKSFMLSTTWNAPAEVFGDPNGFFEGRGIDDVLLPMRKTHQFCGLEELPGFSCHDVIKNPAFEHDRQRLQEHLAGVFANETATTV